MKVEEYVKQRTNEIINDLRSYLAKEGIILTRENERYIRVGISYGISISATALSKLPIELTMDE